MALPANPVGIYWESYYGVQTRIINIPTQYNVIFLFQALPTTPTGAIVFQRGATTATLNADIATCRARGQRCIMTCGGANAQITINSQATADAFIQSVKDANVAFGGSGTTAAIDGIDWNNFEGSQAGTASPAWMAYASTQLKSYYGSDFLITAPPACTNFDNQRTADRLLLATIHDAGSLDWLCPQFYDGPGNNTQATVDDALDFYNTAITVNGHSVQIPRNKIGIGFRCDAEPYSWTVANAAAAYTDAVNDGNEPKGAFNFSANNDPTFSFATTVAPVINNNEDPPVDTPAFELVASPNFTDGTNTTAQLSAPSGKSTNDFWPGELCETSNPAPSVDIPTDDYTELEWCIQATADAVNGRQYEFRVTYNGTALDTYTVTPKWTIGETPAVTRGTTGVASMTNVTSITF